MEPIRLTDHAALRIQQRGIPGWFLRLLVEHGKTTHDGHGAVLKSVAKSTSSATDGAQAGQIYFGEQVGK